MLNLTVKDNGKILIGDDIVISISSHRRTNACRVSIDAPKDVKILRESLVQRDSSGEND